MVVRPEILNLESKVKTEILNVSDRLIVCKQQCILSDLRAALGREFDSSGVTEWRNKWRIINYPGTRLTCKILVNACIN